MYDVSESRFSHHGPCESCGSKDNVAWYSNGTGYCFGCGKLYRGLGSSSSFATTKRANNTFDSSPNQGNSRGIRSPPDDCCNYFPYRVIDWINQYQLTAVDLIKHNVKWSPSREQLIYFFYASDSATSGSFSGEGDDVVLWQARNFREGTDHKHRFFTGGTPADVIATYGKSSEGGKGVLVEDCISAIKIAMSGGGVGIPCFSASMSLAKLARLADRFKTLHVWLDSDKFGESITMSNRLKLLGCNSRVISTEDDPKCYNLTAIKRWIE